MEGINRIVATKTNAFTTVKNNIAMENEREINQLTRQYEMEHVSRRNAGKCSVESSVIFIELLWELEHIGDHLANIAVRTPEIQKHYVSLNK